MLVLSTHMNTLNCNQNTHARNIEVGGGLNEKKKHLNYANMCLMYMRVRVCVCSFMLNHQDTFA